MKQPNDHIHIVCDYATRIKLQNRALAEKREAARKDIGRIIYLWQTRQWQEKHTEQGPEGGAA